MLVLHWRSGQYRFREVQYGVRWTFHALECFPSTGYDLPFEGGRAAPAGQSTTSPLFVYWDRFDDFGACDRLRLRSLTERTRIRRWPNGYDHLSLG